VRLQARTVPPRGSGPRTRRTLTLAAVAGTLLAAAALPTAAFAVDGGRPSDDPSVVRLISNEGNRIGLCTGVQVSATVILTARHCDLGGTWDVYWPSGPAGQYDYDRKGTVARGDAVAAAEGDLSVLRLSSPHPLASYPKVNARYVPRAGDPISLVGTISDQRTIDGYVIGDGTSSFGARTIQVRTPGGGSRQGDSGGPLLVNGEVVGVLSLVNGLEDSWYAMLSAPAAAALVADQLPGTEVGSLGGVSSAPYYAIKNVSTGLALDTRDGTVGAQIAQQRFNGATSQQWTLIRDGQNVRIVNRASGQVIGVPDGSRVPGEKTVQWDALGVADQAWNKAGNPDGSFTFTNANSGQVLVPAGGSAGDSVLQNPARGTDSEKWTLVRVG